MCTLLLFRSFESVALLAPTPILLLFIPNAPDEEVATDLWFIPPYVDKNPEALALYWGTGGGGGGCTLWIEGGIDGGIWPA